MKINQSPSNENPLPFAPRKILSGHLGVVTRIGLGIILTIGGIFLLSAACHALPHTGNFLNQKSLPGEIAGYVLSVAGATTAILYSVKLYNSLDWLFEGSQSNCKGFVSIKEANQILSELDKHKPEGIQFNARKITDSIKGGTCSAMVLAFLDFYFQIKRSCPKSANYKTWMLRKLEEGADKFVSSSQEMRNRQAAYNCIEVVKPSDQIDHARNKIQALANYHQLFINWSSRQIDSTHTDAMIDEIQRLPEGVYFLRLLKLADNEKLEDEGHSLVYIKENGLNLFYDPNFGLKEISFLNKSYLFENFSIYSDKYQVKDGRFYRLCPI